MHGRRRYSRFVIVAAAALSGAVACADPLSPDRSPDVLPGAGGPAARDSMPNVGSDTTIPRGRLRGTVIATSPDSTAPWKPVQRVRVEAAQRDAKTGEMKLLATTASDAEGRFVFEQLDVPTGLVFLRALPGTETPYRTSRWLAAYSFVEPWLTLAGGATGAPRFSWTLGPFLLLERADAAPSEYAPVLLVVHVVDDSSVAIAGARFIVRRAAVLGKDTVAAGVASSGRTDGNGFALMALSSPGLYMSQLTLPTGSPYREFAMGSPFTAVAATEATRIMIWGFTAGRR